jgi:MarR family transcriptional regulator, transcriptional regulator for hemolysin
MTAPLPTALTCSTGPAEPVAPAPERTVPDLAFLLSRTGHVLTTELTAALAGLGTTPRAHCVLAHALTGSYTQGQLAQLCALDKTTMVVTLDELERDGLARRDPSPTDRRARIVAVTDAGREQVAAGQRIVDGVHGDVLDSLPAEHRDSFLAALTALTSTRLAEPVPCEAPPRRRAPRRPA